MLFYLDTLPLDSPFMTTGDCFVYFCIYIIFFIFIGFVKKKFFVCSCVAICSYFGWRTYM